MNWVISRIRWILGLPKFEYKLLVSNAVPPQRAKAEDACFDVCSIDQVVIQPGGKDVVRTGVAICPQWGFYYATESRSGLLFKESVYGHRGIIDSGYTGELCIILRNDSPSSYMVDVGDRIAQISINKTYPLSLKKVTKFSKGLVTRGTKGYGSTGK